MTLADIVSSELRRRQRSQRWLARALGVAPQTVSNMVRGQRPDFSTLCKLSQFLGEPVGLLLNAAGFEPAISDPSNPRAVTIADDWPTVKTLCIMRSLPPDRRQRLLQVIQLFAEDGGPARCMAQPIAVGLADARCALNRNSQPWP